MRYAIIVGLALVWMFLAYRAYERGDMALAGIFLAVGALLTVYRVMRSR
jgi:hypothetical protein